MLTAPPVLNLIALTVRLNKSIENAESGLAFAKSAFNIFDVYFANLYPYILKIHIRVSFPQDIFIKAVTVKHPADFIFKSANIQTWALSISVIISIASELLITVFKHWVIPYIKSLSDMLIIFLQLSFDTATNPDIFDCCHAACTSYCSILDIVSAHRD